MVIPKLLPSGRIVDLATFSAADVNAWDIAWSLSGINRYNAATRQMYSVATHTALCYTLALVQRPNLDDSTKLAILLHDAAEAYVGDMLSFLKLAHPGLQDIEDTIAGVIYDRFRLDYLNVDTALVALVDLQAAYYEIKHYWPDTDIVAAMRGNVPDVSGVTEQVVLPPTVSAKQYVAILMASSSVSKFDPVYEVPDLLAPLVSPESVVEQSSAPHVLRETSVDDPTARVVDFRQDEFFNRRLPS